MIMRLEDLKRALTEAGWGAVGDAQHYGIEDLHKKLFPVIAQLESENFELYCQCSED
jgi:hypothetical protein